MKRYVERACTCSGGCLRECPVLWLVSHATPLTSFLAIEGCGARDYIVASLVRMLERPFNDLYLMFSCLRIATGDVVSFSLYGLILSCTHLLCYVVLFDFVFVVFLCFIS